MPTTYTDNDVAYGVNCLDDFYNAWPYNTGIDVGAFKAYYTTDQIGVLGQTYQSVTESVGQTAMSSMAATWGMEEPSINDFFTALDAAGASNIFASSLSGGISDSISQAASAATAAAGDVEAVASSVASGVTSVASWVSGTNFLWLIGIAVVGYVVIVFTPELKAGAKGVSKVYGDTRDGIKKSYSDIKEGTSRVASKVGLSKSANPRRKRRKSRRA